MGTVLCRPYRYVNVTPIAVPMIPLPMLFTRQSCALIEAQTVPTGVFGKQKKKRKPVVSSSAQSGISRRNRSILTCLLETSFIDWLAWKVPYSL